MVYIAKNSDQNEVSSSSQGSDLFFDQLSSKSALVVGLVTGIMTLCTIGFIVLLYITLAK